jgi:chemotaxis protein methyltransferase CheR
VSDTGCRELLEWALPRLGLRFSGFRNVRGQVCKRVRRRTKTLGLAGFDAYREYLTGHAGEWRVLDSMCRVTISRFYRDHEVFELLEREVLPELARRGEVRVLSLGCASGEEPYGLALLWRHRFASRYPDTRFRIVATDADAGEIERARAGRYSLSTLRELPAEWIESDFVRDGNAWIVGDAARALVELRTEDLRQGLPGGTFDIVLCRNLAFTYFDAAGQDAACRAICSRLPEGGVLVIGRGESLPPGFPLREVGAGSGVHRRV